MLPRGLDPAGKAVDIPRRVVCSPAPRALRGVGCICDSGFGGERDNTGSAGPNLAPRVTDPRLTPLSKNEVDQDNWKQYREGRQAEYARGVIVRLMMRRSVLFSGTDNLAPRSYMINYRQN